MHGNSSIGIHERQRKVKGLFTFVSDAQIGNTQIRFLLQFKNENHKLIGQQFFN